MQFWAVLTWIFLGLCAYVYVGYPLLLALMAKFLRRPVAYGDAKPKVSLIIAAYNEQDVIGAKIENTRRLSYPADLLETIIVTDGSNDATPEIVRERGGKGIELLHSPERRGKSAAINRGVEKAAGAILVFSDANAFYDADAIDKLVRNFNDATVGCASGRKTVQRSDSKIGESEGAYWKYESFIKKKESQLGSTTGVVGEMLAIRRELFAPIPAGIINDDAYLAMRVMQSGYRVIYEAEAICRETSAMSTRDEVIRRQRINAGRYQLLFSPRLWPWKNLLALWELISHKYLRLLLPLFMIGALVANVFAGLPDSRYPILVLTLVAQGAFYALAFVGWNAEQRGQKLKLPAVAYYITSSNIASLRGMARYLRGNQTVLWEKAARSRAAGA